MSHPPQRSHEDAEGYVIRDRRLVGKSETGGPLDNAAPHPAPTQELEQLRQEIQRAQEQHLRTLAEFDNTKKRLAREQEEFAKFAAEALVRQLLPIVDSLDQALVAVDKQRDPQAVIKGVHLIYRQLLGLLEKEGVTRIPTVGERFDPHLHEAVAHVESTDSRPDGTIVEEVHVGYTMHGKVVRPALVKVAKPREQKTEDRNQKSENREQRTEDGEQKTDQDNGE